jgi:hypothetical protein
MKICWFQVYHSSTLLNLQLAVKNERHCTLCKSPKQANKVRISNKEMIYNTPLPVWVGTCRRLRLWTSKMFTQITGTNLDSILHTPMCCECE